MKYLVIILILFFAELKSQQLFLNFDKRYIDCEDKWVAIRNDKDSTYGYGFVYLDEQAGLTIDVAGSFRITPDNKFLPKKLDSFSYKIRLDQPNHNKVAIIPNSRLLELQISKIPDWLKFYKQSKDSVRRLVKLGYTYNAWDECSQALEFLEKAYKINPHYSGLEFELGYAYNALKKYDKAISVLENAIKLDSTECLFYKELSYAEGHKGLLENAEKSCLKCMAICTDAETKADIAYNLASQYFLKKDKVKFSIWSEETKKWGTENKQMMESLNYMITDIDK